MPPNTHSTGGKFFLGIQRYLFCEFVKTLFKTKAQSTQFEYFWKALFPGTCFIIFHAYGVFFVFWVPQGNSFSRKQCNYSAYFDQVLWNHEEEGRGSGYREGVIHCFLSLGLSQLSLLCPPVPSGRGHTNFTAEVDPHQNTLTHYVTQGLCNYAPSKRKLYRFHTKKLTKTKPQKYGATRKYGPSSLVWGPC